LQEDVSCQEDISQMFESMNDMLDPTERLRKLKKQDKLILPESSRLVEKFTELLWDVSLFVNKYSRKNRISECIV
jgi:hypothetical protein